MAQTCLAYLPLLWSVVVPSPALPLRRNTPVLLLQAEGTASQRHGPHHHDARRVPAQVPRARRLRQLHRVVRRSRGLPLRGRRGPRPLLRPAAAAAVLPLPGLRRGAPGRADRVLRGMEGVPAPPPALHPPDAPQEPLVGHRHRRGEGRHLLTWRQFCAVRRGRQGDHRVTAALRRSAQNWRPERNCDVQGAHHNARRPIFNGTSSLQGYALM